MELGAMNRLIVVVSHLLNASCASCFVLGFICFSGIDG